MNSKFTDIALYSQFGEEINVKITDLYTPMVWKEIEENSEQDIHKNNQQQNEEITTKPNDSGISIYDLLSQVCLDIQDAIY